LQPLRLPFPPPRKVGSEEVHVMYEKKEPKEDGEKNGKHAKEEKKSSNDNNYNIKEDPDALMPMAASEPIKGTPAAAAVLPQDPELSAPFLNLNDPNVTPDQKREEQLSWMVFKLPTRLPRLAPHCTQSGRALKNDPDDGPVPDDASSGAGGDGIDPGDFPMPDDAPSSNVQSKSSGSNSTAAAPTSSTNTSGAGYDDTLKDSAAGKYGKIVIHKSGKAYLVVGGTDSKTPQVKMMLTEGLPCGFLQQAVAIDPNNASYVPLGEVKKTLVATPDIESAFV